MVNYVTKEGIAAELSSYASFYECMRLRSEWGQHGFLDAHWEGNTCLTPFTVLGRYHSNGFGQCSRLNREMFTDEDRAAMPPVMTDEEFQTFLDQHVRPRITGPFYATHEGVSGNAPAFLLPPPHLLCARCGGGWELDTCHDIDAEGSYDYVIQPEDSMSVSRYNFYHGACFREHKSERLVQEEADSIEGLTQMFEEAGFEDVRIARRPLPKRCLALFAGDLKQSEVNQIVTEIPYYRVNAKQGYFGLLLAPFPLLDLAGTGISQRELEPELAKEIPPDFPPIAYFSGDSEQLVRLSQLMLKQRQKSKKRSRKNKKSK